MDPSHELSQEEAQLTEFSQTFDEFGPGPVLARVGAKLGLPEGRQQEIIAEWQHVADQLNQLQVADASVSGSIMNRIRATTSQPTIQFADQRVQKSEGRSDFIAQKSRRQLAKIIALATSSVAMLSVSLQVATHEESLTRSAEVLASFSFDPQGWDVVVVTVSDEQADQLSRDLERPSAAGDLKVLPVLENRHPEDNSVGVMMASKETSEKLLGKLAEAPVHSDAEWNPRMVGELDRAELLKRFADSMKTPTRSDLFFREVIVVTSDQDNGFRVTSRASESDVRGDSVVKAAHPAVREALSRQLASESVLQQLQNNGRRPVLVVLKRRSDPAPGSQGSTSPIQPGFAVYL